MGYMKNAEEIDGIGQDNRRSLLLEAHKNFATLAHLYGDLWEKGAVLCGDRRCSIKNSS